MGNYAEALDAAVKEARINNKWRRDYMSIALKFREYEKLGESRGIKIGKVIGGEIGALATKVSGVRNNREESTDEQIIKFLRIDKKWFKTTLIDIVVI